MQKELRIPLAWKWIEDVRKTVSLMLKDHPQELRESAVMVASELAENIVKYGIPIGEDDSGRIAIELHDGVLTVLAENGAAPEGARAVQALFQTIEHAPDVQALYVQRLGEMASAPGDSRTKLGFLRIAFEGSFALSVEYTPPRLRIFARRRALP